MFLKADSSMNIGLSSRKYNSGIIKKNSDPLGESHNNLNGQASPSRINSSNYNQVQPSQLHASNGSQGKKNERSEVIKATTS